MHLSFFDQVLLSGSNLLIGLLFIRFATKTDYYLYAQILGYVTLSLSIQAALVNTTALTLLPRKEGSSRRAISNAFFGLQLVLSVFLALLLTIAIGLSPSALAMDTTNWVFPFAMGWLIIAAWLREFVRNIYFIQLRPDLSFWQDIIYVGLLTISVLALLYADRFATGYVVFTLAILGLFTTLPWLKTAGLKPVTSLEALKGLWKEIWPLAKWSLPAGLVAWGFGNGYLLIGANLLGPEATAEIVAAKLFSAPLGTLFASWANVFRPHISHKLADKNGSAVARLTLASLTGVIVVASIYIGLLFSLYPHLESHILGEAYTGLATDISWWGIFFLASGLSSICNGVLLAGGRFKLSFYAALMGFLLSTPLMALLALNYGKSGLMMGVLAGEATYAIVLFIGMRHLLKQTAQQLN